MLQLNFKTIKMCVSTEICITQNQYTIIIVIYATVSSAINNEAKQNAKPEVEQEDNICCQAQLR